MRAALWILASLFAAPALARDWAFVPAVTVSRAHGANVHHHLESAGRKNIAVGNDAVAIAWEDDRAGEPAVFIARKTLAAGTAFNEIKVSTGEAYEPAIVALSDGRFLCVWEQDGAVWARVIASETLGPAVRLAPGAQATLAARGARVFAAWRARAKQGHTIFVAEIAVGGTAPRIEKVQALAPRGDQLYPSVAVNARGAVLVAWEDRRAGHTRIYYVFSREGRRFAAARPMNETVRGSAVFGKGSGAARVALTPYGAAGFAATWLDKRDFQSGYDVYAARDPKGRGLLGANEKVQDDFGAGISQWHAAIAGTPQGELFVAWDDDRDESADIFIATREADGWSENRAIAPAAGEGEQAYPAIAAGSDGALHLAWIETTPGGTRVRYSYAAQ